MYLWVNRSIYKGGFVNGLRQGSGAWISNTGVKYEGEYVNNMKHGLGVYIEKNGCRLRGKFFEGKFVEK